MSAVCIGADKRVYACFQRGTIWSFDQSTEQWRLFASGLHVPLGILPGKPGEFFVVQMPELTRVADTDGDGKAETFETICDRWGMSGNYHEFAFGPVRDRHGNFYVGLGCASSSGGIREPVRGRQIEARPRGGRYGHISPVSYRGWLVKITPDGEMTPVANGFRQPNGLLQLADGELFVVDNQGDWVGTSPLYHIVPGSFYGHPASLLWDPNIKGNPLELPFKELSKRRRLPAIQFPQTDIAGSITSPTLDTTGGRFGPYHGQIIVADWKHPRLHRVALEKIDGVFQGACFPFIEGGGLRKGNNSLTFAADGSLYVAQSSRVWGGTGDGLQRITWTGKTFFDILTIRLLPNGFAMRFTLPVTPETVKNPGALTLVRYRYRYHSQYGSPKIDTKEIQVQRLTLDRDQLTIRLTVDPDELLEGFIYELRPHGFRSQGGEKLVTRLAAYTLNRSLPKTP